MITKFDDIIEMKFGRDVPAKKVAVVGADYDYAIGAIMKAYDQGNLKKDEL